MKKREDVKCPICGGEIEVIMGQLLTGDMRYTFLCHGCEQKVVLDGKEIWTVCPTSMTLRNKPRRKRHVESIIRLAKQKHAMIMQSYYDKGLIRRVKEEEGVKEDDTI